VRFYARTRGPEAGAYERARVALRRRQREALLAARREVERVYAEQPPGPARDASRAEVDVRTREAFARLAPAGEAAAWSARVRSNDACLALAATYAGLTPCLDAALAARGGDLATLVADLVAAAGHDDPRKALFGAASCAPDSL
jgi:hypothetical protein